MYDDRTKFVIAEAIMQRRGKFTTQDIVNHLQTTTLTQYTGWELYDLVQQRLDILCETGIASNSGLGYYYI